MNITSLGLQSLYYKINFVSSAASLAPSSVAAPAESPAHPGASGQAPGADTGDKETTTLIHNEEESFALAPVSLDWTRMRTGDQ